MLANYWPKWLSNIIALAIGGMSGVFSRALVAYFFSWWQLPGHFATLSVNLFGSLAIGVLFPMLAAAPGWSRSLLITGFLGGLTTFSSFALDCVVIGEKRGFLALSGLILAHVGIGVAACYCGVYIGRKLAFFN